MSKESGYTATLAHMYANQGHIRKAMEIYRVLIRENPERADFRKSLKEMEEQADENFDEMDAEKQTPDSLEELAPLFEQWVELLLQYNRLCGAKKIKKRFSVILPADSKIKP